MPRGMIVTLCSGSAPSVHHGNQRMSGFVIRRDAFFMFADEHRLARNTHQHLVLREFEIFLRDRLLVHARRIQRRFVHQIGQIGAGESRSASRNDGDIDIIGQRNLAHVNRRECLRVL